MEFNDLENGHWYSMLEPNGTGFDAGRLYKIKNYNDEFVKIIYTRNISGEPIYMSAYIKIIPGTIFQEETDVETDPEFPDDEGDETEFFNFTPEEYADENFKNDLIKAFDKIEYSKKGGGKRLKTKRLKTKRRKTKRRKTKRRKTKRRKTNRQRKNK